MSHWLAVIKGNQLGKRFSLTTGQGTIGRGLSNSVQLADPEVSRVHCRYNFDGQSVQLADLGSSNGTLVNHVAIEQHELSPGDHIYVGTTVLEYRSQQASSVSGADEESSVTERILPSTGATTEGQTNSLSYLPVAQKVAVDLTHQEDAGANDSEVAQQMVQVSADLNFMYRASLVTSSKANREDMLERVVDLIFEWIEADRCCVLMRDEKTNELEVKSSRTRTHASTGDKVLVSQSIINYVRKHRVGILTSDAIQDQRLSSEDSIVTMGIREAICVPIQGRGEILGLVYVDALDTNGAIGVQRFNEDNLKLMIAIAHQMAFALENESYFASLLQQERLATIGQTTSSLSHHIKNVLQGINGGSHLIDEGLRDGNLEMIKAGWQIVNRTQTEVSKLVNDMLIIGQPYRPNFVNADLNAVIRKALEEITPNLSRWNVDYTWVPGKDLETFRFDPRGIHWAVFNVVNSCAAACREVTNGRIKIWLEHDLKDSVTIKVSDNGLPAVVESPEHLFSPTKTNFNHPMNPVVLAVSRKLIRGHAGDISVEYPATGGNLFSLRLPLAPPKG